MSERTFGVYAAPVRPKSRREEEMTQTIAQIVHQIRRPIRVVLVATALVATMIPSLRVAAQGADSKGLFVDIPLAHTMVSNGDTVAIGGWTAGSRVDIYLDGPAGVGIGLGSVMVGTPRPDVAKATAESNLASSGFELSWHPKDLSAGPHTLYIYALTDGSWTLRTVPIMGRGNAYFEAEPEPKRLDRGNSSRDDDDDRPFIR
jgi:hypothetical protein